MTSFYTPIAAKIPENLTKPTASFKKHVWLSILGLLFFIVMYVALMVWFGRLSYTLFVEALNFDGSLIKYALSVGFGFLSFFMAKSLILINKREKDDTVKYITQKEEPALFDFLYKLADEAGAPRPHKVFLSNRVNASVSYDLSLFNLIFPSKKNLEIGLGLVNILNIGEFKAVLAHEYGHFAQRSMLLGRYVYVAQQIAHKIVNKRDFFDSMLSGLSRIDIRIAWIGWILSIMVWSIRSIIEICFSIVMIAERALSREMEFQADLVAVSLTGSDALIHALYKLQIADEAYGNTLGEINYQLRDKKVVKDMYTLQSNYVEKMAVVLDKAEYGKSPVVPNVNAANHRVFTSRKYNPPQMWSTHPADVDRENNAKNVYVNEPIDNSSSWNLFTKASEYREELTHLLVKTADVKTEPLEAEAAIAQQNKRNFNWLFLRPQYHSAYLNRYSFLNFKSIDELFTDNEGVVLTSNAFEQLYPKSLNEDVNLLNELLEEQEALLVRQNETLTLEKRVIWHRGNQIKQRDIEGILNTLKTEIHDLREKLKAHDKRCRILHFKAAKKLNTDWGNYTKQLAALTHYAEHTISNINDVRLKYNNTLNIALADGRISSSELKEILGVCHDYYNVITKVYNHSNTIELSEELLSNMKAKSYKSLFEEYKLPPPHEENINDWTQVIDSWVQGPLEVLDNLRHESLELLLETEDKIKDAFVNNSVLSPIVPKIKALAEYSTLTPGSERVIQRKLGAWDRFFVGDGIIPTIAKFAVAGGILFASLFYGSYNQKLPVYIYNGLSTTVDVSVDGSLYELRPNSKRELKLNYGTDYTIVTTNSDNQTIEELDVSIDEHLPHIYNVANSAAFITYPVFYGYDGNGSTELLGVKQWFPVEGDHILETPPSSISSSGSREVVEVYNDLPSNILNAVDDKTDQDKMISSHSLWDSADSKDVTTWLMYLGQVENAPDIVSERLKKYPTELISLRASQDVADSISRLSICEKHIALSKKNPNNGDYYYLATRCIEDEDLKDTAFLKGHKKWKNHAWLAYASSYVYAQKEQWKQAMNAFDVVNEQDKGLTNLIASDMYRVSRIANAYAMNYTFPLDNEDITYYKSLESGVIEGKTGNPNYVFHSIHKGKLLEALTLSRSFSDSESYVLRLLAASKNPPKGVIKRLEALEPAEGVNLNTVWATVGLNIKNNEDYTDYLSVFEPLDFESGYLEELITLVKTKNKSGLKAHVKDLQIKWKAETYVMALTAWGSVPNEWEIIIKNALYANEKPYFGLR